MTTARDERGQTLAEYALILFLVFVACVVAVGVLGTAISAFFDTALGWF